MILHNFKKIVHHFAPPLVILKPCVSQTVNVYDALFYTDNVDTKAVKLQKGQNSGITNLAKSQETWETMVCDVMMYQVHVYIHAFTHRRIASHGM